jgi:hypothetical protein
MNAFPCDQRRCRQQGRCDKQGDVHGVISERLQSLGSTDGVEGAILGRDHVGFKQLCDENFGAAALGANRQSKPLEITEPPGCFVSVDRDPKRLEKHTAKSFQAVRRRLFDDASLNEGDVDAVRL